MRTLIIVLALTTLAAAAGLSFILQAGAQQPPTLSATLDASCSGEAGAIPRGVDTLVTCTFTATNTGTAVLADPMLYFVPSANVQPPQRYYFWSYTLDNVRQPSSGSDTAYAFAQIVPGASSTMVVEIIVRAFGRFGADVQLGPGLDQVTIINNVTDAPQSLAVPALKLEHVTVEPHGEPGTALFNVMPINGRDVAARPVSVELDPGYDATIRAGAWALVEGTARFVHHYGDIPESVGFGEIATIESINGSCPYGSLVAVATFQYDDGVVRVPARAEDVSPALCDSLGLAPPALPQGGFGPPAEHVEPALTLAAMLAGILGFATIGLAIFLVR